MAVAPSTTRNLKSEHMEFWFFEIVDLLILLLEAIGVAVILGGFIVSTLVYLMRFRHWTTHTAYRA